MRSKNTNTYESQNRSFLYTMIAVVAVLVVVGLVAYGTRGLVGRTPGTQNPVELGPSSNGGKIPQNDSMSQLQDIGVSQTVPSVDSRDSVSEKKEEENGGIKSNYGFDMPVEGNILKEFSSEIPIYSKTLEQYEVHFGVDIEATADSQVKAIDGGTVTAVYQDDKLGLTIEINHGDGYVSKYSNLSTDQLVEESDVVERGQVISGVGNSAMFETLDPEHLHFELWKDGQAVDPEEYL